ncbi:hypothetical protein F941_01203 [Acinetobacter bouvetii DSM 14964 = CIP 107468]|uniref:Uncharacterized protein n=1 Tax=Acinetobacter bouvetii DSM 14964 = CIP 107468 TaxID=1120925 RepID=N9DRM3_9GAMM|nr:DUF58 domain-containing protein [Acinetobacter bouvetii]ENV83108.1 hypothetical protein F941_01203 [Acinetobacter bouvetii DSM 14964 = CIP 107468]BCU65180.1 membrane protein [Acinetobacter bouvetii]
MASAWQNWLSKRFKIDYEKQLKQSDVLVFIYQQGYLFLVLILITFIAGVNYANNLILGFCFLISAVLCVSFYLTFKQLHALKIEIHCYEVGQVGEALHLDLFFSQEQKQARYLWISVEGQLHQLQINELKKLFRLRFLPAERGQFHYPVIRIWSVYPFGLVRAWTYLYLQQVSWIAPKAAVSAAENKNMHPRFEQDVDEFRELKDYRDGESLQAVAWKHAARGQGLYVKVFEQYQDQRLVEIHYDHMPSPSHEEKLSLMMGLAEQCEQMHCAYSIFLPNAQLPSGTGEKQLMQAKLLLAQA